MKILLICNTGMSTSLVEANIKKYGEENKANIEVIALSLADARSQLNDYDVILLGPQLGFELQKIRKTVPDKPVEVIPGPIYAMGKAKEIIELANKIIKEKKAG